MGKLVSVSASSKTKAGNSESCIHTRFHTQEYAVQNVVGLRNATIDATECNTLQCPDPRYTHGNGGFFSIKCNSAKGVQGPSGRRGRKFNSCRPDSTKPRKTPVFLGFSRFLASRLKPPKLSEIDSVTLVLTPAHVTNAYLQLWAISTISSPESRVYGLLVRGVSNQAPTPRRPAVCVV